MRNRRWHIVVLIFLAWGLSSLPSGASGANLPPVLNMGCLPTGSLLYAVTSTVTSTLSRHLPSQFKPLPTTGPLEWGAMLSTKEVDLGIGPNGDMQDLWLARNEYKDVIRTKKAPVRLLSISFPIRIGVITRADSGIMTGKDVKGRKYVGNYTGSPGQCRQARAMLANFGLDPKDVTMISVPNVSAGVQAVTDGRAEANGTSSLVMGGVRELDAARGARYISMDPSPEALKRAQEIWPGEIVKVKADTIKLKGTPDDVYVYSYDQYIVARETLDNDTAYAIVKSLWELNAEIQKMTPKALELWTKDRFVRESALIPYHDGAVRFYREIGIWKAEMDALQKNLLAQ